MHNAWCVLGVGEGVISLFFVGESLPEKEEGSSERQERARKKAIVACGEEDEERWRESAASLDLWEQLGTLLQGTNCFYLFLNILFFKTFNNIYFQIYTFFCHIRHDKTRLLHHSDWYDNVILLRHSRWRNSAVLLK